MRLKIVALLIACSSLLSAQVPVMSSVDPAGNCTANSSLWINGSTGVAWVCQGNTWQKSGTPLAAGLLTPLDTAPTGTGPVVLQNAPTIWAPVIADPTTPSKQILFSASGATASTAVTLSAAQAGNITVNLPVNAGGLTNAYWCGATTGSQACGNTGTGGTARVIGGIATLATNTAVISGISPAFTSTSSFTCVANDTTTRANPVQVANTTTASITITDTTGASDVISWMCVGY